MQVKYSADQIADIATSLYETIQLHPRPVQIAVLTGSLVVLITEAVERGAQVPQDLVALLPSLQQEMTAAIDVLEQLGVNVGEAH